MPIEDIILKYKNKIIEMDQNKEKRISRESEDEPSSSKESSISKPESSGMLDNNCLLEKYVNVLLLWYLVESNDACGSSSSVTGIYSFEFILLFKIYS